MNETLVNQIRHCPSLPSLPAIAIQVLDLAQRNEVDIAEIARVISKDPALSSKILRTVNSSFYGRSQSISTISHALVILGLQSVKTLVLGFSLVTNLTKNKGKGFKHLNYWRRSIYAATAARTIAAKLQFVQQEECFLASLLSDLGMLVLDQVQGDVYGEIHEKVKTHSELSAAETSALGMTHAQAVGILAEQWKLPPLLAVPMSMHHSPQEVTDPALKKITEVVYLAARCADVFVDENAAPAIAEVRAFCSQHYRWAQADCDAMLETICSRTKEIAPLFEIHIQSATNYESILKKANETLVDLTLRTQQQAATLQQLTQKLKQQAATDGLTGLANRAMFDQFMEQRFKAAREQNKPIGMLLLDLDHFKLVNDRFGHQAGDHVLRAIGKLLRSAARSQDLAARYGGEEMVMVMPGTTRATAAAVAESIRRAIAAQVIVFEGTKIPVTASVGVAVSEPPNGFADAAALIKASDLAVYAAKHGGRNCVRVFKSQAKTAA